MCPNRASVDSHNRTYPLCGVMVRDPGRCRRVPSPLGTIPLPFAGKLPCGQHCAGPDWTIPFVVLFSPTPTPCSTWAWKAICHQAAAAWCSDRALLVVPRSCARWRRPERLSRFATAEGLDLGACWCPTTPAARTRIAAASRAGHPAFIFLMLSGCHRGYGGVRPAIPNERVGGLVSQLKAWVHTGGRLVSALRVPDKGTSRVRQWGV